jgi:hypothetical protein
MRPPTLNSRIPILAAAIGGSLAILSFQIEHTPAVQEYMVLPGTFVFLMLSGGHAGASHLAMIASPIFAVVTNMIVYAFIAVGLARISHLSIKRKMSNENL